MQIKKNIGTLAFYKLESVDSDDYFVKLSQVVESNIESKITKLSLFYFVFNTLKLIYNTIDNSFQRN